MEQRQTCLNCFDNFAKSPRHKKHNYCKKPSCQKVRKKEWQRHKVHTDPEYKANQKLSNKKWKKAHPDYWKKYRSKNPEKTERNRILQKLRNRKKRDKKSGKIAKMDASKTSESRMIPGIGGEYWLVPVIAKMDASRVFIVVNSMGSG